MKRTFKSKIGIGYHLFMWASLLLMCLCLWLHWNIFAVFLLVINIFTVHACLKTEYVIENEELTVKSGYFPPKVIPLESIASIHEAKNNQSFAYACSFDRLAIVCQSGEIIFISPADKSGFIKQINKVKGKK